ncbi:MAG: hypothetical protein QM489_04940 [Candidatus Izemoplasma sp.]
MITPFKLSDIEQCIKLIKRLNKGNMKVRYYPTDPDGIKQRLIKRYNSNNVKILLYLENEKVAGILELLIDEETKYLQILAVFIDRDTNQTLDKYFKEIKKTYINFKLMYVLSDFNIVYINYMEKLGAVTDGDEIMISITPRQFLCGEVSNVSKLDKSYAKEFTLLHNNLYQDVYWTAELLLRTGSPFDIFVIIENNILVSYAVISSKKSEEEEIFFLHTLSVKDKTSLLRKSISSAFEYAKEVILLLESSEIINVDYYESLGFNKKEVIISYSLIT